LILSKKTHDIFRTKANGELCNLFENCPNDLFWVTPMVLGAVFIGMAPIGVLPLMGCVGVFSVARSGGFCS